MITPDRADLTNARFLHGHIEAIPLPDYHDRKIRPRIARELSIGRESADRWMLTSRLADRKIRLTAADLILAAVSARAIVGRRSRYDGRWISWRHRP